MDWNMLTLILTVIFGIATIISIIIAIRLARKKKPIWAYRTEHLIGRGSNAPPELKVLFNNKEVSDVYKTNILFFNKGNDTIENIETARAIAVHFKKAEILKPPSVKSNKETIEFVARHIIRDGDNAVELNFNWLGHNDGAIIEVLHTESDSIEQTGEFKNIRLVKLKEFNAKYPKNIWAVIKSRIFTIVIFMAIPITMTISSFISDIPINDLIPIFIIFSFMLIMVTISMLKDMMRFIEIPHWARKS